MEQKKKLIVSALYYVLIAAAVILALRYVLGIILPFVIGFAIAALLSPTVRFLSQRYKMKYRHTAFFVLVIAYTTVGTLFAFIIVRTALWLGGFLGELPELYKTSVEPAIGRIYEWISDIAARFEGTGEGALFGGIDGFFESLSASLTGAVTDISVRALSFLSGIAAAVPRVIVELSFAILSSFFFLADFEKILSFVKRILPRKAARFLCDMRGKFFVTAGKYLRSYMILMLLTFALLFFGLLLIGTKNAMMYALIIALLDILPIIGTGIIMIPWAIISIFGGNVGYGVSLLLVWGVTCVVRNIAEPKIVGRQVGLHPLLTLISIFVGGKLLGFFGLILFPVGLSIILSAVRDKEMLTGGGDAVPIAKEKNL